MIPVEIGGIGVEPMTHSFVVVLQAEDGEKMVPIHIGSSEAQAIMMHLEGTDPDRPLTHDLTTSIIDALDASVERLVVSNIVDNTFIGELILSLPGGETTTLDCRPSDGIAIALRTDADLAVEQSVMDEAGREQGVHPDEVDEESINIKDVADEDERRRMMLKEQINQAVSEENYERAAELRDKLHEQQQSPGGDEDDESEDET